MSSDEDRFSDRKVVPYPTRNKLRMAAEYESALALEGKALEGLWARMTFRSQNRGATAG